MIVFAPMPNLAYLNPELIVVQHAGSGRARSQSELVRTHECRQLSGARQHCCHGQGKDLRSDCENVSFVEYTDIA